MSPVPEWSPVPALSADPLYGHAEPIVVSADEPNTALDMTNPIDRIIRRERDRMQLMNA